MNDEPADNLQDAIEALSAAFRVYDAEPPRSVEKARMQVAVFDAARRLVEGAQLHRRGPNGGLSLEDGTPLPIPVETYDPADQPEWDDEVRRAMEEAM
jgi:hypothetical protein